MIEDVAAWAAEQRTQLKERARHEGCDYCQGGPGEDDDWVVPGKPPEQKHPDTCHCGHESNAHSFHVLFCPECPCYSLHFSGENYDAIHDRWN
jgi:hypothetical protein